MRKQIYLIILVALCGVASAQYGPVYSPNRCPINSGNGNGRRCFRDRDCSGLRICCGRRGLIQPGFCTYPEGLITIPAEKNGQCPRVRPGTVGICVEACVNDFSCPGSQKCCSNGCGRVCRRPRGLITVPAEKDGRCPRVRPGTVGICVEACVTDFSCPGSQKCCSNGCGRVCRRPRGLIAVPPEKDGQCPRVRPGTVGICVEACVNDLSCPGSQKCCSNGCGRVCTRPRGLRSYFG